MKSFVLTLTPNPALDLGGMVDDLKPNEKSYVYDETKAPGGNAINAARILNRLKVPVVASGFLGGSTGDEIRFLLDEEKVKNLFVPIRGHSRISVTVSNRKNHQQTRLTFPGPSISTAEKQKLFSLVKEGRNLSCLVIGGSLPKGFSTSDVVRLARLAQQRNIPYVVDLPGKLLRDVIKAGPFLMKPNLLEFQEMTGSRVTSLKDVRKKAERLLDQIPFVCVSSVQGGTLLATRQGSFFGSTPRIQVKSTVGAGDSMVGAMVAQIHKKNFSGEDLLRWGLAASAATLIHPGTAFGSARDIHHFYAKTRVHRL